MHILAISGSLRESSLTTTFLRAVIRLAPPHVDFLLYAGVAELPHFSPDLDIDPAPDSVQNLREMLKKAGGVIICTPEYAYGVPGSLKNALDWTVSSGEFLDKPTIAMSVSPNAGGGARAFDSLRMTLTALTAKIVVNDPLLIPLVRSKLDDDGNISDAETARIVQTAYAALVRAMNHPE